MNILHISTHNENCGIGKYQEFYLKAMTAVDSSVKHAFFPYSPNKMRLMSDKNFAVVCNELLQQLAQYDLVHIQHEFSFYKAKHLAEIVSIIKSAHKPLVSTVHTGPTLEKTTRHILSPKGIPARLKNHVRNASHINLVNPLSRADVTFVHNNFTKEALLEIGFDKHNIRVIPIPVPEVSIKDLKKYESQVANINLHINRNEGDVVLATVGFLNEVKGVFQAIKMLRWLPANYKLTILGGIHPLAGNDVFLDYVADYILDHDLKNRVYITGFVKDDELLNAYVANSDVVLYPYYKIYSSSSAALNNGFANYKPLVATPVKAFLEINNADNFIVITESFSYHDLAEKIINLEPSQIEYQSDMSRLYAKNNSYPKMAEALLSTYRSLVTK